MQRLSLLSAGWLLAALFLSIGCSTERKAKPAPAPPTIPATGYLPTDPERVELIPWAPLRLHQRLGEITVLPATNSTRGDVELSLRESAAALGAHALFIVSDPRHQLAAVQVDPLVEEHLERYPTNGIVAVAIRYQ